METLDLFFPISFVSLIAIRTCTFLGVMVMELGILVASGCHVKIFQ